MMQEPRCRECPDETQAAVPATASTSAQVPGAGVAEAYESLSEVGEQFPERARRAAPQCDATYRHPVQGDQGVAIDPVALAGTGQVYADPVLREAFGKYGAEPLAAAQAVAVLRQSFESGGMVWGFSGFATPGYPYAVEAQGMSMLLDCLKSSGQEPAMVIDGGVSAGVLGLSGVLARQHRIPGMGFLPKQGLFSFGPRDHLVVKTDTYPDRERIVGTAPDVLVCVGGGEGTRRECETALAHGSTVLLLTLKDYGPAAAAMNPAAAGGRLVRCRDLDGIPEAAGLAAAAGRRYSVLKRPARMEALTGLLAE